MTVRSRCRSEISGKEQQLQRQLTNIVHGSYLNSTAHVLSAPQYGFTVPITCVCRKRKALESPSPPPSRSRPKASTPRPTKRCQCTPENPEPRNRYSFAFTPPSSSLARSRSSRLRILPTAFLGSSSTNRTPPGSCLYAASRPCAKEFTSESLNTPADRGTTYALGTSLPPSIGMPTTAASKI
jgi:hypothetical protein